MFGSRLQVAVRPVVAAVLVVSSSLGLAMAAGAAPAAAAGQVAIPGSGTEGPANPYPLQIPISGHSGVIADVNVNLDDLTHDNPRDIDMLLVAPDGNTRVLFLSDAGGATDLVNIDLVLDDEAATDVPDTGLVSGTYRPTDPEHYVGFREMPPPAPGSELAEADVPPIQLGFFDGLDPNGVWTLWVSDDTDGSAGSLGGVTLDITTEEATAIPGSGTQGAANPYPIEVAVSGHSGTINDLNIGLEGLTHSDPSDLDVLLVAPDGVTRSWLMSDAGGGEALLNTWVGFDDEAPAEVPSAIETGRYRPTNAVADDALPAPAPEGSAPASLSVFDGLDPNGTWRLYVYDDKASDTGHLFKVHVDPVTGVRIPAATDVAGAGEPYPLEIPISGLTGLVSDVNVTLDSFESYYPAGFDMLLVAPDGTTRTWLLSDVGGGDFSELYDLDLVVDDEADKAMPAVAPMTDGTYRASNYVDDGEPRTDTMPAPAPDSATAPASLSVFDGLDPNGTWLLYAHDDGPGGPGSLAGITLDISTVTPAAIPGSGTTGRANPYPVRIAVSGHTGTVQDVNVVMDRLVHASAADVDMLLVAPNGRTRSWLLSDAGGSSPVDARLVIDDEAAAPAPSPLVAGTYQPTNAVNDDLLPRPEPGRVLKTAMSVFDGLDPNGTWTLYVYDDSADAAGLLANVTLDISTGVRIPATGSAGAADPYPLRIPVSKMDGVISDLNVRLTDLDHTNSSDIDMLLVAPDGSTRSWVMSDAPEYGGIHLSNADLVIDDEAPAPMPFSSLESGTYRPTNGGWSDDEDVLPAPAPNGPAPASFAEFDGLDPNGTWLLYIADDNAGRLTGGARGGIGMLGAVSLDITTKDPTPESIVIPSSRRGQADPYPVRIDIAGRVGSIQDLDVELSGLQHSAAADLDMLLVAPDGVTRSWLLSDAGGAKPVDASLVLDDEAASGVPAPIVSGTYRPTNAVADDVLPAPAPSGSAPTSLAAFDGLDPNGTWTLYVYDDTVRNGGRLADVSLHITAGLTIPDSGPADPYPFQIRVSGQAGPVTDVNVVLSDFSHSFPSDVAVLLVAPDGLTSSWLLNFAGGAAPVVNADLVFDDEAAREVPAPIVSGTYQPTNLWPGGSLPEPAPQGDWPTSLTAFDGIDPNGTWSLYVYDWFAGDSGSLGDVRLEFGG